MNACGDDHGLSYANVGQMHGNACWSNGDEYVYEFSGYQFLAIWFSEILYLLFVV